MKKYVTVTTNMGEAGTHLCSSGLFIPRDYIDTDLSVSCRNGCDLHKDTPDTEHHNYFTLCPQRRVKTAVSFLEKVMHSNHHQDLKEHKKWQWML